MIAAIRRFLAVPLLLFVAVPLPGRVVVIPPGPTSATPVDLRVAVACMPLSHTVTRVGNLIKVDVTPGPELCDPPIATPYTVPIGALPVGEYRVEVTRGGLDSIADSGSFIVRNGARTPVEIHPFAVPTTPFGLKLRVSSDRHGLCTPECAAVSVGGVPIPAEQVEGTWDALWFPAPPHAPGLVDVTVAGATTTWTLPGGLYYFDPSTPPDVSVFERILFPTLVHTQGAHGSEWVSEVTLANPKPWFVDNFNDVQGLACIVPPCGTRFAPGMVTKFDGDHYPRGVALLSPRAEAPSLSFALRVRDVSRQAEGYGTEVPVVREADMFANTDLTLLDVPVDPRYRTKLRVYAFDSADHTGFVTMYREPGHGALREMLDVKMSRSCAGIACAWTPWYGEVDLPPGDGGERVDVYVTLATPDSPAWAFASVTNNETQQVTLVTSDGAGGRPCDPCEVP